MSLVIDGFRGGPGGHALQDAKVALFCLVYAMHYKNLCSKTNKIYTQYMHFRGFSCPKSVCELKLCFNGKWAALSHTVIAHVIGKLWYRQ